MYGLRTEEVLALRLFRASSSMAPYLSRLSRSGRAASPRPYDRRRGVRAAIHSLSSSLAPMAPPKAGSEVRNKKANSISNRMPEGLRNTSMI
jgi:hypothetical protein